MVIFQREAILDLWSVQKGFSKKPTIKIGDFALRKKGREKTRMAKRAQKTMTKKRKLIFKFKIFNINSEVIST